MCIRDSNTRGIEIKRNLLKELERNYFRYNNKTPDAEIKITTRFDALKWFPYIMNKKGEEFKDVDGYKTLVKNDEYLEVVRLLRENRQNTEPKDAVIDFAGWTSLLFSVCIGLPVYGLFHLFYNMSSHRTVLSVVSSIFVIVIIMCVLSWLQRINITIEPTKD